MNAHSNSTTILALALNPTVRANAAATAVDALVALFAVDTQPAAAAFFAQILLSKVLAQCSSPAVFASGSVTIVRAKRSSVYGLWRRHKAAESALTGAASILAPPAAPGRPASAPFGLLVVAAQETHKLALRHDSRQRHLGQPVRPRVLVVSVLPRTLRFAAGLRAQTTHDTLGAEEMAASEQMERAGAAVADIPHEALVVVEYLGSLAAGRVAGSGGAF
jgi:hypothetical protein